MKYPIGTIIYGSDDGEAWTGTIIRRWLDNDYMEITYLITWEDDDEDMQYNEDEIDEMIEKNYITIKAPAQMITVNEDNFTL